MTAVPALALTERHRAPVDVHGARGPALDGAVTAGDGLRLATARTGRGPADVHRLGRAAEVRVPLALRARPAGELATPTLLGALALAADARAHRRPRAEGWLPRSRHLVDLAVAIVVHAVADLALRRPAALAGELTAHARVLPEVRGAALGTDP